MKRALVAITTLGALGLGGCAANVSQFRYLPLADQDLWKACRPTLARICRATFEPTWDTCLNGKKSSFIETPSYAGRQAYLLGEGCPTKIVKSARKTSREALAPKPAGGKKTAPPLPADAPPPPSEAPTS